MVDFGKSIENYETLFDSPWKMPDWAYMKDHVIPKAQVEETPELPLQGKCQKMTLFKCQDRYKMTLFKSVIY